MRLKVSYIANILGYYGIISHIANNKVRLLEVESATSENSVHEDYGQKCVSDFHKLAINE